MEAKEFAEEMNARLKAMGEKEKRPNDMGKLLKKYTDHLSQCGIQFVRDRPGQVEYEFKKIPTVNKPSVTMKVYCEDCAHYINDPFQGIHRCEAHDHNFESGIDPQGKEMTGCDKFQLKAYDWTIEPLSTEGNGAESEKMILADLLGPTLSNRNAEESEYDGYKPVFDTP